MKNSFFEKLYEPSGAGCVVNGPSAPIDNQVEKGQTERTTIDSAIDGSLRNHASGHIWIYHIFQQSVLFPLQTHAWDQAHYVVVTTSNHYIFLIFIL